MFFDTGYKGLHHFLDDVIIQAHHRYVVEFSRAIGSIIICNATNPAYVAIGSPAICSVAFPLGAESLDDDGLDFYSLATGVGRSIYGRYRYTFRVSGYTVVTITDYGPLEVVLPESDSDSSQLAAPAEKQPEELDESECSECGYS